MIGLAIAVFGGLLAGAYLHELIHVGVARAAGASRVAIDPIKLDAHWQFEASPPAWTLWAINLAPQACGILTLTAWWVFGAPTGNIGIGMLLFGVMLLAGGRDDYRVSNAA